VDRESPISSKSLDNADLHGSMLGAVRTFSRRDVKGEARSEKPSPSGVGTAKFPGEAKGCPGGLRFGSPGQSLQKNGTCP
jgi:hypothetical protein